MIQNTTVEIEGAADEAAMNHDAVAYEQIGAELRRIRVEDLKAGDRVEIFDDLAFRLVRYDVVSVAYKGDIVIDCAIRLREIATGRERTTYRMPRQMITQVI